MNTKYVQVIDGDGIWYMIPINKKDDWLDYDESDSPNIPDYAIKINKELT